MRDPNRIEPFLEELGKLNLDDNVLCQLESYLDINNSNLTLSPGNILI